MKRRSILALVSLITLVASLLNVTPVGANPPYPEDPSSKSGSTPILIEPNGQRIVSPGKAIDQPNPLEVMKIRAREELLKQGNYAAVAELDSLAVDDHVLVILVEYAGTDTFTWTPGVSMWDPIGQANTAESANPGDCSKVVGIPTVATDFTYGPTLHNTIPRPLSAADASGNTIWTPDFSNDWFDDFMFGNGVVFDYTRVDSSVVLEDFTGKSVVNYYQDMSGGAYNFSGDVIGWIQLPHSAWWYGADECPGARSNASGVARANAYGAIPGAGNAQSLVKDSLAKVEEMRAAGDLPLFNWADYDPDGNGVIDRLWIVHSGYGEEDSTTLTNRTNYGEAAIWSHSSSLSPLYTIPGTTYQAGAYIMMPENGGIGVFAHEYAHNLGADDLYAYNGGETSAGFWTLMADDWTGYPLGYQPPSVDPWHLDRWGWLNPEVISDPAQVYTVTVGQASEFPGGTGVERGVKIQLPEGQAPLPVVPATGTYNWWGGKLSLSNAKMTLNNPIAVPAGGATFSFDIAYDIEAEWDFLWVQASTDGGTTWNTLTNADTICTHDPGWIGELNGFPTDMCAAGIGGLTNYNPSFPDYDTESFTLDDATYGGHNVVLRFWYMTDWATEYAGPFIDNIQVDAISPAANLFSDGAETAGNWTFTESFQRTNGTMAFDHNLYLQWRNTSATGGYDAGLGDPRYRYGPVSGGLLVWYNNNFYTDNEVTSYLTDYPSYGTKGRMLVLDANPDPVRLPSMVSTGYDNEVGNLPSRSLMRDAAFSQLPGAAYSYGGFNFSGQSAVPFFDDSLGYYPGAEYVSRGPGYTPASTAWKWVTKQWDASAVVPSNSFYPFDAPGYMPNDELRYWCAPSSIVGRIGCYFYGAATGLGYAGGTGNPGDYAAQYGWHVEIVSQTATTATLRIWNANAHHSFAPDKTLVSRGTPVKFTYDLTDAPVDENLFVCTDLDTTKVSYVSGTNAIPLIAPCGTASPLALMGGSLATTRNAAQVVAVAYMQGVSAGGDATFDFTVKPLNVGDHFTQALSVYDNDIHRVYMADEVSTMPIQTFFPTIGK